MGPDEVEQARADAEAAEVEDFDQFWSSMGRHGVPLRNVFGVDVELPPEMPLQFDIEVERLYTARDADATRRMIGLLFGEEALARWTERGIDQEQLGVLLLWGAENTRGNRITLRQAWGEYQRRRATRDGDDDQGKDPDPGEATNGPSLSEGGA